MVDQDGQGFTAPPGHKAAQPGRGVEGGRFALPGRLETLGRFQPDSDMEGFFQADFANFQPDGMDRFEFGQDLADRGRQNDQFAGGLEPGLFVGLKSPSILGQHFELEGSQAQAAGMFDVFSGEPVAKPDAPEFFGDAKPAAPAALTP